MWTTSTPRWNSWRTPICTFWALGKKPTTNGPEVGEGSFAIHGTSSFGFHFELLACPHGRAYRNDFTNRRTDPDGAARASCLTAFGLHFDLVDGATAGWHPARPAE